MMDSLAGSPVRLARSEQWAEMEQHDQFCVALEGTASDYYTLLLETNPGVRLGPSLRSLRNALDLQRRATAA